MLNTDAKPKFHRPRPIPYALHGKVDAELERMRKEGILKPVEKSEWAAPIVVVRKGDGNVRICGDYKVTITPYIDLDQYPMPNPNDLFSTLAGGKKFSRLDLKQAYQQMLVDPRSQQYLTINTHKGMFTYTRMPFGISSAPSIWQRAIDNVLSGLDGVICYLDDILIVGNSDEQHNHRLFKVLERLNQAGIKLKMEKCEFGKSKVEYLGHVVSAEGISPSRSKMEAIQNAPDPSNVTELKAFLGLLNYYGKFLPNLSSTLQPLYILLKKQQRWKWLDQQRKAFRHAKRILVKSDLLVHYDLGKPIKLSCDALPYGVGACLSHVMEDGTERPVAFASRTLASAEKNYAHLEKEALALIYGVRHFNKYLMGRKFTLLTDHRPLLRILGAKEGVPTLAAARLQRWALILSAYSYELEYRAGQDNKEADVLSRLPIPVEVIDPNEQIFGVDYCEPLPMTANKIAKATQLNVVTRRAY